MVRIIRNEFEKNLVLTQWNISLKDIWVELDEFNVGLELRQQVIADSLGFIPKDNPETCHRNFDPPQRGWLPRFVLAMNEINTNCLNHKFNEK